MVEYRNRRDSDSAIFSRSSLRSCAYIQLSKGFKGSIAPLVYRFIHSFTLFTAITRAITIDMKESLKTTSNKELLESYEGFKRYEYSCEVHDNLPEPFELEKLQLTKNEILRRMNNPDVVKIKVKNI